MDKIYYDPSHPAGFSSIAKLAEAARVHPKVAKKWLLAQDTYTTHRIARKKFPRNRYVLDNIDQLWQADLCDMRRLSEHNDNVNYILTVIDCTSKRAWAVPLPSKHNHAVISAFKHIFEQGRKPYSLMTDKGKEFVGKSVLQFFKAHNVNYFTTRNPDVKASIVERFNRTLKERMYRYLSYKNTYRYVDVLQDLVHSYNNTVHSSILMKPSEVNETNLLTVLRNLNRGHRGLNTRIKPKLKVGTHVRVAVERSVFAKVGEKYFSEEIFKISRVVRRPVPVYELEDFGGEKIDGLFYGHELMPVIVSDDKTYKINKILGRRLKNGSRQVLVSWVGYNDPKFNQWISEKDLITLK